MRQLFVIVCACLVTPALVQAQGRGGGPPPTAKAIAPIDITGYWTAVVTEDWHVRMLTPSKGDFGSGVAGTIENPGVGFVGAGPNPAAQGNIPYNTIAAQTAMKWDPAKDEAEGNACKAYGAPGIMRLPTHLHITWQDDNTLKVDADYGTQTRLFHFAPPATQGRLDYGNATLLPVRPSRLEPPAGVEPSVQGYSVAQWTIMGGSGNFERGGNLKVATNRLKPGYYWKNGMPYTGNAAVTEYFRTMELPDRSQWIRYTQVVDDPEYLTQPWIVNYAFKKLPDGSKWNPTPCSVK
ncbi:MAG TPA: hypothetical protein VGJ78_15460 [Vicinamibacterales bacterium]|jgi:hypothetical protein